MKFVVLVHKVVDDYVIDTWTTRDPPRSTLAQVTDHIDHIRTAPASTTSASAATSTASTARHQPGVEDVSKYPALVAELLRRGYSDADVEKIIGGNILRVMTAVEQVAATLQKQRGPSTATLAPLARE